MTPYSTAIPLKPTTIRPCYNLSSVFGSAFLTITLFVSTQSPAATNDPHTDSIGNYLSLAKSLCAASDSVPTQLASHQTRKSDIIIRGSTIGVETTFSTDKPTDNTITLQAIEPVGRPRNVMMTVSKKAESKLLPSMRFVLGNKCEFIQASRISYKDQTALFIENFDESLQALAPKEWLNPPLPEAFGRNTGLKVALIDSGVNYTISTISNALALDTDSNLIGYDYWDNDRTPYDANPARSAFFVQRHGTRTASILIREAPEVALVPYRYPRPDMNRMKQLIDHAASYSIRIIGMPLGSNRSEEWQAFSEAAAHHPTILFVVSAGNNGRDIDQYAVYPAVLEHPNILVVTSSDDYAKPADRTNYGKVSVDYMLPAEKIAATDYIGETVRVSGSSYAVSRMTAMAARILSKSPEMNIEMLKSTIASYSVKANTGQYVSVGYIGDPLADTVDLKIDTDETYRGVEKSGTYKVFINLVSLDKRWSNKKIASAVATLNTLYKQCNISVSTSNLIRVTNTGHLANLSPGNAMTLQQKLKHTLNPSAVTIFFANDTDMQDKFDAEAFGIANTANRPWMRNTVWISANTKDYGHALAHELFHVLTNSGRHSQLKDNLMQNKTALLNIKLDADQCQRAISNAKESGLLHLH